MKGTGKRGGRPRKQQKMTNGVDKDKKVSKTKKIQGTPLSPPPGSYPSSATCDFPALPTTGITHATEEHVDDPVHVKLEHQDVPTIHALLGLENQKLGQHCETLHSFPEVVVCNNTPPSNADMVLISNAVGPETRSDESGARPTKSGSVNITRIAALMNDYSSDDEVESMHDCMSVNINGYRVKREAAPILKRIFLKYGDIAKQCSFSSVCISSSLLEFVCDICKKLDTTDFRSIKPTELESMLAEVRDLESAKVDVGWLLQRLNDISQTKQLVQEHFKLKEAQTRNLVFMETNKKEREELKKELAACIATCHILQERLHKKEDEFGTVDSENQRIQKSYENTKAKVKVFLEQSLIHGLL